MLPLSFPNSAPFLLPTTTCCLPGFTPIPFLQASSCDAADWPGGSALDKVAEKWFLRGGKLIRSSSLVRRSNVVREKGHRLREADAIKTYLLHSHLRRAFPFQRRPTPWAPSTQDKALTQQNQFLSLLRRTALREPGSFVIAPVAKTELHNHWSGNAALLAPSLNDHDGSRCGISSRYVFQPSTTLNEGRVPMILSSAILVSPPFCFIAFNLPVWTKDRVHEDNAVVHARAAGSDGEEFHELSSRIEAVSLQFPVIIPDLLATE
ncbi:hypothetical protein C8J56DRAFT_1139788 [Mycena floridula]|nr:hypothetical protein C8J56DRAFT_1139788 [Mycena floridula]